MLATCTGYLRDGPVIGGMGEGEGGGLQDRQKRTWTHLSVTVPSSAVTQTDNAVAVSQFLICYHQNVKGNAGVDDSSFNASFTRNA